MKRLAYIAEAAALAAISAPAMADPLDFVLTNMTVKVIEKIEVAATGTDSWMPNKIDPELNKDPRVKLGHRTTVNFDRSESCKYDVRATFEDGTSVVWSNINLCDFSFVTVRFSGDKPTFVAN